MPVTKSAKKKLRKDKKREIDNKKLKNTLIKLIKQAKKNPTAENLKKAVKTLDISVKKRIIHPNKASRIKSKLSKLIKQKRPVKTGGKSKRTTARKTSKK